MTTKCFSDLSDRELLAAVRALAANEREATARLIASLMEIDSRRLYLGEGCSSLFTFCTQALRLSEHAAYGRIEAARAARRFPIVLELLADGSVTLTTITLLGPVLTLENHREVLGSARHKSKREVEQIVAALRPQPAVPSVIRKLPGPKQNPMPPELVDPVVSDSDRAFAVPAAPPKRPAVVAPLAPELYRVQFTMSRDMNEKLRRVQDLLRHVIPTGDVAAVFERALTLLLTELEKNRCAATSRPQRPHAATSFSRHVPAAIKRKVWARDGGRCAFVGTSGRCTETGFLEYHHVVPFAEGGEAMLENLQLRCRAHNQHEAELYFGPMFVKEERAAWT